MNNEEAERVDKRVAEHVEGVREKCAGTRNEAETKLDNEHEGVDREDRPQHTSVTGPDRVELACFGFAAIIHGIALFPATGTVHCCAARARGSPRFFESRLVDDSH